MVKNPPANAEDTGVGGSIPGLGRCLEEKNGYPLQYSCLENPVGRGAWRATVHEIAKSQTWLSGTHNTLTKDGKTWVSNFLRLCGWYVAELVVEHSGCTVWVSATPL